MRLFTSVLPLPFGPNPRVVRKVLAEKGQKVDLVDVGVPGVLDLRQRLAQPIPDDLTRLKAWRERMPAGPSAHAVNVVRPQPEHAAT